MKDYLIKNKLLGKTIPISKIAHTIYAPLRAYKVAPLGQSSLCSTQKAESKAPSLKRDSRDFIVTPSGPLWGPSGPLWGPLGPQRRTLAQRGLEGPFFNFTFDKGRLKNLVSWTLQHYGHYKTVELLEQLKKTGFEYATKAGISLGIDDLKIPPKKHVLLLSAEQLTKVTTQQYQRGDITAVERFQRLIDTWHRTSEQLKQEVISHFEETDILNPVYMMAFSGARGNISQVRQLVGMRGLMSDPQGQIIDFPIQSNFREGLTLTEYIISSYGARKGIVDTALRTANAGYLTRRLVDVAQHVIISHYDCGTKKGIFLLDMKEGNKTIVSARTRIIGRVLARDIYKPKTNIKIFSRNQEITTDVAFEITKYTNKVFVRSALTCNTTKLICQLCYGWSLAQGNLVSVGEAVGVIAAQSIGEPGTQLTMRTFHTGGVFSGDVSDEIRAPYNGFVHYDNIIPGVLIRTLDGKIGFLTKSDGFLFFSLNKKLDLSSDIKKFKIPPYTLLLARNGESVIQKQVVAQITSIGSFQTAKRDTAELIIKSDFEGLFYAKNLQIKKSIIGPKPKFTGPGKEKLVMEPKAMEIVVKARGWNFAWVLSGKRYEIPLLLKTFPRIGDYINNQTIMARHYSAVDNQLSTRAPKETTYCISLCETQGPQRGNGSRVNTRPLDKEANKTEVLYLKTYKTKLKGPTSEKFQKLRLFRRAKNYKQIFNGFYTKFSHVKSFKYFKSDFALLKADLVQQPARYKFGASRFAGVNQSPYSQRPLSAPLVNRANSEGFLLPPSGPTIYAQRAERGVQTEMHQRRGKANTLGTEGAPERGQKGLLGFGGPEYNICKMLLHNLIFLNRQKIKYHKIGYFQFLNTRNTKTKNSNFLFFDFQPNCRPSAFGSLASSSFQPEGVPCGDFLAVLQKSEKQSLSSKIKDVFENIPYTEFKFNYDFINPHVFFSASSFKKDSKHKGSILLKRFKPKTDLFFSLSPVGPKLQQNVMAAPSEPFGPKRGFSHFEKTHLVRTDFAFCKASFIKTLQNNILSVNALKNSTVTQKTKVLTIDGLSKKTQTRLNNLINTYKTIKCFKKQYKLYKNVIHYKKARKQVYSLDTPEPFGPPLKRLKRAESKAIKSVLHKFFTNSGYPCLINSSTRHFLKNQQTSYQTLLVKSWLNNKNNVVHSFQNTLVLNKFNKAPPLRGVAKNQILIHSNEPLLTKLNKKAQFKKGFRFIFSKAPLIDFLNFGTLSYPSGPKGAENLKQQVTKECNTKDFLVSVPNNTPAPTALSGGPLLYLPKGANKSNFICATPTLFLPLRGNDAHTAPLGAGSIFVENLSKIKIFEYSKIVTTDIRKKCILKHFKKTNSALYTQKARCSCPEGAQRVINKIQKYEHKQHTKIKSALKKIVKDTSKTPNTFVSQKLLINKNHLCLISNYFVLKKTNFKTVNTQEASGPLTGVFTKNWCSTIYSRLNKLFFSYMIVYNTQKITKKTKQKIKKLLLNKGTKKLVYLFKDNVLLSERNNQVFFAFAPLGGRAIGRHNICPTTEALSAKALSAKALWAYIAHQQRGPKGATKQYKSVGTDHSHYWQRPIISLDMETKATVWVYKTRRMVSQIKPAFSPISYPFGAKEGAHNQNSVTYPGKSSVDNLVFYNNAINPHFNISMKMLSKLETKNVVLKQKPYPIFEVVKQIGRSYRKYIVTSFRQRRALQVALDPPKMAVLSARTPTLFLPLRGNNARAQGAYIAEKILANKPSEPQKAPEGPPSGPPEVPEKSFRQTSIPDPAVVRDLNKFFKTEILKQNFVWIKNKKPRFLPKQLEKQKQASSFNSPGGAEGAIGSCPEGARANSSTISYPGGAVTEINNIVNPFGFLSLYMPKGPSLSEGATTTKKPEDGSRTNPSGLLCHLAKPLWAYIVHPPLGNDLQAPEKIINSFKLLKKNLKQIVMKITSTYILFRPLPEVLFLDKFKKFVLHKKIFHKLRKKNNSTTICDVAPSLFFKQSTYQLPFGPQYLSRCPEGARAIYAKGGANPQAGAQYMPKGLKASLKGARKGAYIENFIKAKQKRDLNLLPKCPTTYQLPFGPPKSGGPVALDYVVAPSGQEQSGSKAAGNICPKGETNYFSPYQGELLYTKPYKTYLELNPYENLKTGLKNAYLPLWSSEARHRGQEKGGLGGSKGHLENLKKTKEEKIRMAMFQYYLKTLNRQKTSHQKGWSRCSLILTKTDLITLNYVFSSEQNRTIFSEIKIPSCFNLLVQSTIDAQRGTKGGLGGQDKVTNVPKISYEQAFLNNLVKQELKNNNQFTTLSQLNKTYHFNKTYCFNMKKLWSLQNLLNTPKGAIYAHGGPPVRVYQIKTRVPVKSKTSKQIGNYVSPLSVCYQVPLWAERLSNTKRLPLSGPLWAYIGQHKGLENDTNIYYSNYLCIKLKLWFKTKNIGFANETKKLQPYFERTNFKWLFLKQKNLSIKNKVGFFFLKGSYFVPGYILPSGLKAPFSTYLSDLPAQSRLNKEKGPGFQTKTWASIEPWRANNASYVLALPRTNVVTFGGRLLNKKTYDFRYLESKVTFELQKFHLNGNFLTLKPEYDKTFFANKSLSNAFIGSCPFGATAAIKSASTNEGASQEETEGNDDFLVTPPGPPGLQRSIMLLQRIAVYKNTIFSNLQNIDKSHVLLIKQQKFNMLKPINYNTFSYIHKEIDYCKYFEALSSPSEKAPRGDTIYAPGPSGNICPKGAIYRDTESLWDKLRLIYNMLRITSIYKNKNFNFTEARPFGRATRGSPTLFSIGKKPIDDAKPISRDALRDKQVQVLKKSGQLIHMNKQKITLRIGQPLVISPRSIIHNTHGDFIKNKTTVITLTYEQLKTGDIVQGIPKIEQLFEARTTKRGRLFRDNISNLLTGLFLKYFVKSTSLLSKNRIKLSSLKGQGPPLRPGGQLIVLPLYKSERHQQRAPFGKTKKTWRANNVVTFGPNGTKQNQTMLLALALQWSVKQSFYKIQQIIVDGILRVYRSQGVSIADKHVEIIVKQMTSKVRIINYNKSKMNDYIFSLKNINPYFVKNPQTARAQRAHIVDKQGSAFYGPKGQQPKRKEPTDAKTLETLFVSNVDGATGLFPGEIVDHSFVENINTFLLKTANVDQLQMSSLEAQRSPESPFAIEPIKYEPIVLGITRASLEVDSFLSAASFQQTTKVLSQAALYKKKDFLKGLKENIIIGNLIPAGTGYLSSPRLGAI